MSRNTIPRGMATLSTFKKTKDAFIKIAYQAKAFWVLVTRVCKNKSQDVSYLGF